MNRRVFKTTKDSRKDYERLIGFYSDEEMDVGLILLSLIRKVSKSVLLRHIVKRYFTKALSIERLCNELAAQAVMKFTMEYKQVSERPESLVLFKKELRYDLKSRNIPEKYVQLITTKFDEKANSTDEA